MFERINFQGDMYKVICKVANNHVGNRKLKLEYDADLVLKIGNLFNEKISHEHTARGQFGERITSILYDVYAYGYL